MYHHIISEVRTVFHLPIVTSNLDKNGVRYKGPVLLNKLLTEGFNHTVSEAVFVKQLMPSNKICILWYWKYQISMAILKKIHKKHCSLNYYIVLMYLIFFSKNWVSSHKVTTEPFLWVSVALSCIRLEGRKPWTKRNHTKSTIKELKIFLIWHGYQHVKKLHHKSPAPQDNEQACMFRSP